MKIKLMSKNTNKRLMYFGVFLCVALLFTLLVKVVDVRAIGPKGTSVGFSHINGFFHKLSGVNMILYDITDFLGIVSILVVVYFAFKGFMQLVREKSLFKVDKYIIALGVLYGVVMATYVVFEVLIINYRPIIMPGEIEVEASFPSSHTMLICVVLGSAAIVWSKVWEGNETLRKCLVYACYFCIGFTIAGRLFSGVHWFTDILGGVFYSLAMIEAFLIAVGELEERDMLK